MAFLWLVVPINILHPAYYSIILWYVYSITCHQNLKASINTKYLSSKKGGNYKRIRIKRIS